jgi:tRNA1(Val) A37 N6-methylase TrmN6
MRGDFERGKVIQTEGTLLDGRVAYHQLRNGHRSGFEPVLLAACVPARPGERVLEAGTGAGAALLCLAARVPGVSGVGVEIVPELAALAEANFRANGFNLLSALRADATALPFGPDSFHHVLANPPWFNAASTASPDAARDLAHRAQPGTLASWTTELLRTLRTGGSISLVLPASAFAGAAALLRPACGGVTLMPLWPRTGTAAKMVILTARKGSKTPDSVHPGLVLHDGHGISPAAQAVLRGGATLP